MIGGDEIIFNGKYKGFKLEGKHTKVDCEKCHVRKEVKFAEFSKKKTVFAGNFANLKSGKCNDCHFDKPGKLVFYSELDVESKKIFDLRDYNHSDKPMIITGISDFPLLNTWFDNDTAFFIGKEIK